MPCKNSTTLISGVNFLTCIIFYLNCTYSVLDSDKKSKSKNDNQNKSKEDQQSKPKKKGKMLI